MSRTRTLLPADTCPHHTLDGRDRTKLVCRECGTPWALVQAADRNTAEPDLFGGGQ